MRSALLLEQESVSESCSGVTTPNSSSRRNLKDHSSAESGYNTGSSGLLEGGSGSSIGNNVGKTSVVSEESGSEVGNGGDKITEQSQASQKTSTSNSVGTKRPKPLTRRNTYAISSPSRSRAGHVQARSRLDSADDSGLTSVNRRSVGAGNPSSRDKSTTESQGGTPRKKALSPPSSTQNRRLLPATPMRRSEKAHLAATRPKSMIATSPTTSGGSLSLAENNKETPPSKAKEGDSQATEDNQMNGKSSDTPTSADEVSSQLYSKADGESAGEGSDTLGVLHGNSLIKHTVAYKDSSPLYKDGESLADTQSVDVFIHSLHVHVFNTCEDNDVIACTLILYKHMIAYHIKLTVWDDNNYQSIIFNMLVYPLGK